jgi:hypothetical protein
MKRRKRRILNEPMGYPRGTIRSIITLWVTLTFCLMCLFGRIPIELALPIFSAIMLSYFVGRRNF